MAADAGGLALWERVKADLKNVFPEETFNLWFNDLVVIAESPDSVTLGAPSDMLEVWITENYQDLLVSKFREAAGRALTVAVRRSDQAVTRTSGPPKQAAPDRPTRRVRAEGASAFASSLNPKNTFENFVIGPNNQMAFAACQSVAKQPATSYNPLVIYGDTGLGKTHLMHAVGHFILRQRPEARVAYLSTEKFTNEFIASISDNCLSRFRQRYRGVDVLLLDDVQFFGNKERTQDEFFHTFNDLFESSKQIILTCDRPVNEIPNLEKRLVTRFQWGLTVDIRTPDYETRLAILKHKQRILGVEIEPWALDFIGKHVVSNIRQLEGALIKLTSFHQLSGRPLTQAAVEDQLRDILVDEARRQVTVETIQKRVADHYNLRVADLVGRRRPANIALARQLAMYLCRELTQHSLLEIGEAFGGRDHGTVIHAVKAVSNLSQQDSSFRNTVEFLRGQLSR